MIQNGNGKNTDAALEVSDQAEYMQYLKTAPITEFAKYAGIDIDEAVNRRVAAAIADAPPKMEVIARPVEPQGKLQQAFFKCVRTLD